jgi:hypothetical protein
LNWEPSKYKSEALSLQPTCLFSGRDRNILLNAFHNPRKVSSSLKLWVLIDTVYFLIFTWNYTSFLVGFELAS